MHFYKTTRSRPPSLIKQKLNLSFKPSVGCSRIYYVITYS